MFFIIQGYFKATAEPGAPQYQSELNEHLGQRMIHVRLAGALRNPDGHETGFMVCLEALDFAAASSYLEKSPYFRAGLYDGVEIAHYAIEVGEGQFK